MTSRTSASPKARVAFSTEYRTTIAPTTNSAISRCGHDWAHEADARTKERAAGISEEPLTAGGAARGVPLAFSRAAPHTAPQRATKNRDGYGFQMRHRRPAERRQVDPFQRAHPDRRGAGRQLSVLHHRAQCRRGRRARPASRRSGPDRRLQTDHSDAADLRRHRRPRARRLQGRRAWQSVPRQYPRMRRHRPCRALFRGWRRDACRGRRRSDPRHRDDRDRADARRSRKPRETRRRAGEEGEGRRQGSRKNFSI